MNTHEHYEELAVGHALNALEPEDEVTFLAHLPGCAACERAVAEHTETLGHLAYATASSEPPAAVLDGIRAGIAASGRAGEFPAPVVSLAEHRSRTVKLTTALVGVAASVVLVAALVLSNLTLQNRNDDLEAQDVAFQGAVKGLLVEGAQRVELTGDGEAVAVVHGNEVELVLSGVKENTKDDVYVLWQQTAAGITAAGAFHVTSDGLTVVDKGLTVADQVQRLMVTLEKGTKAPRTAAGPLVFDSKA